MQQVVTIILDYLNRANIAESDFIKSLKLDRSTWYYIKKGKRNPGNKFWHAIGREYPELAKQLTVIIFHTINHTPSEKHQDGKVSVFRRLYDRLYFRLKMWFCYSKAKSNTEPKKSRRSKTQF